VPPVNEDDPLTADPVKHTGHPFVAGSGFVLYDRARIENCSITGFLYDAIHIEAIDDTKNANQWEIINCRTNANGRHGLYAAGENSNAGIAIGLSCSNNSGWGVYDRSFLGNTYVGCLTENNG